ncbi:coiled-coil domain-containing protein 43 [Tachysurus fulvidraco]|uniref:coiled-coil domain-containing protein 43 n=1 Tax=Tachysurus fulvidraco TaxID=1234273 RepID=UPI001FEDDB81|nr:coiled-coil domain-containing protein 43 [Tachysurus fulvidraco]
MAAPDFSAGEFKKWLNERLDELGADREVYGVYILGVLQEEESDEEKSDALNGILSAFVDEDTLEEVCQQILEQWTDCCSRNAAASNHPEDEVQAIASLMEKQAQIVVKQKEVSEEAKKRKEALLAQYANVTDDEDEVADEEEVAGAVGIPSDKSLFKNTNVDEVLNRRRQQREQAKEEAHKKKEQDKMQREKDKLSKQERKDKEKKRTQKGERKR